MRKGRLVVEDSPESLLDQYQCNLLEQVMLKLCRKDEQIVGIGSNSTSCNHNNKTRLAIRDNSNPMKTGSMTKNNYNVYGKFQENWQLQNQRHSSMRIGSTPQHGANNNTMLGRIRALSTVIWLMFMRHPVWVGSLNMCIRQTSNLGIMVAHFLVQFSDLFRWFCSYLLCKWFWPWQC